MKIFFTILQLITSILLIGSILIQNSKGGLGSAFGGGDVYRTRRGAEKIIFIATIAIACLFLVTSIATLFIR